MMYYFECSLLDVGFRMEGMIIDSYCFACPLHLNFEYILFNVFKVKFKAADVTGSMCVSYEQSLECGKPADLRCKQWPRPI